MTRLSLGLLGAMLACQSCQGCKPEPSTVDTSEPQDTEEDDSDSAQDSPVDTDTAPPPPCEFPEVEPNNNPDQATVAELEGWACGVFDAAYDFDHFQVEVPYAGWLKVDVDAAERGSSAAPFLFVESDSGLGFGADAGAGSSDPLLVVPIPSADTFTILLVDGYNGSGEDFDYQIKTSLTKAPLSWDYGMTDGTTKEAPMTMGWGDRVYGVVDDSQTVHWIELPVPAGKAEVQFQVLAHRYGSPLNSTLRLFPRTDGVVASSYTKISSNDPNSSSWDPTIQTSAEGEESWVISLKVSDGKSTGDVHWFVFQAIEL
ncbi:MAG: hypothetical protein ACI9VR_002105 [Cognaticolwellia sp.]|jgi:hypothetical protein